MAIGQAPLTNCTGHCNNAYPFDEEHFRIYQGELLDTCIWCNKRIVAHSRAIRREIKLQLNIGTAAYDALPPVQKAGYRRQWHETRTNSGLSNHEFFLLHLDDHDLEVPDFMDRDDDAADDPWHYYTNWLDINGDPECEDLDVIDPCPSCGLLHQGPAQAPAQPEPAVIEQAEQHVEQAQEGQVVLPRPPRVNYARNGPRVLARELRSYLAVEEYYDNHGFETYDVHTPPLVRQFNDVFADAFEQVDAYPGYDLWSYNEEIDQQGDEDADVGLHRYIEVKSVIDADSVLISINELRRALENPETYRLAVVTDIDVTSHEDGEGNVTYTGHNGVVQVYSWMGADSAGLLAILNQIADELADSAVTTQWRVFVPGGLLQHVPF